MQKSITSIQDHSSSFLDWAEAMDDALALVDGDGEFLVCNRAMAELFSLDLPVQLDGFSLFDLLDAHACSHVLSCWDTRLMIQREPLTFTASSSAARVNHALWWKARPYGEHGDVLLTVRDLRSDLAELDDAQRAAVGSHGHDGEAFDERATFERVFARVAHDLQAPLRRIKTFGGLVAHQLEEEDASPECIERMEIVLKNARHNARLIEAMNHYFTFDDTPGPPSQTSMRAVLDDALTRAGFESGEVSCLGDLDGAFCVEREVLVEVVAELLANTARFAGAERRVEIDVRHMAQAGRWHITYRDHGPGVAPENHEVMFEPFERLPPQPPKAEQGFGVGLALCRRRMSMLRGSIDTVDSPTGLALELTFVEP